MWSIGLIARCGHWVRYSSRHQFAASIRVSELAILQAKVSGKTILRKTLNKIKAYDGELLL
jgi:hypothetical protein